MAAQCGTNAAWFECDVTDLDALARAVAGTVERFGGIDVVMANAGIAPRDGPLDGPRRLRAHDRDQPARRVAHGARGLPHVIERQGYVLVIASLAAAIHGPGMAAYSASKAGAEAFGDSLRQEVKHLGVDVGVGYFSFIDTDMVRGADAHPAIGNLRHRCQRPDQQDLPALDAGQAIADGIEKRRRWIVVPPWARALLVLRTALAPLLDRVSHDTAAQADAEFLKDVEERGMQQPRPHPSGPAARPLTRSLPETPRGGEADRAAEAEAEAEPEPEPERETAAS